MQKDKSGYVKFLKSPDFIVFLTVLLLFTSGFTIYFENRPASPSFNIGDVTFKFNETEEALEFVAKAQRGQIELKEVLINNVTAKSENVRQSHSQRRRDRKLLCRIQLEIGWILTSIMLSMVDDDRPTESTARAPVITQNVSLDVENVNLTLSSEADLRLVQPNMKLRAMARTACTLLL